MHLESSSHLLFNTGKPEVGIFFPQNFSGFILPLLSIKSFVIMYLGLVSQPYCQGSSSYPLPLLSRQWAIDSDPPAPSRLDRETERHRRLESSWCQEWPSTGGKMPGLLPRTAKSSLEPRTTTPMKPRPVSTPVPRGVAHSRRVFASCNQNNPDRLF